MGKNCDLKDDTLLFTPNFAQVIDRKNTIKDLGVYIDDDLTYNSQLNSAISKANQKVFWVLRTFRTRKLEFMRKMWKSLIQCHLDYGSILWSPSQKKTDLKRQEGPLRAFSKRIQ